MIKQKLQQQESVSQIHEKYQSLVENLSVGVYRNTPGPHGHFLEANSAMVAMFEAKSKEEFMKHSVSDLYQSPKERKEVVAEIIKNGEIKSKEINLITLQGKKIVASVSAVMKKDENGDVYFDGIVKDITEDTKMKDELLKYRDTLELQVKKRTLQYEETNNKLYVEIAERKKAEDILQKNNQELQDTKKAMLNVMEDLETTKTLIELEKVKDEAVLASIGEGLVAVDNNRKIMIMNKAAEDMLGWKINEMIGKEITSLTLEDESGNVLPLHQRPTYISLATGKLIESNYFFVRKDKTRFPIAINVTPIKLGGKIIGAIDIFRDISREKEIDKAKSEFVSLASHQLRTPLGIAKWYLEAIIGEGYLKDVSQVARDYIDQVYKSNERLLALVRDLLSISRIDQGKVKDTPKPTNITELMTTIVKAMNILATKNKIALALDWKKSKIPVILIDSFRVQEVIENLITNAIVYSNPGAKVTVTIDTTDSEIQIAVKDTGIGISSKDKKQLFTKFFRSEKAVTKNTEGSGLGLYVVKSYVEGWGGKISVESKEGSGSTFCISLPLTKKNKVNK